MAYFSERATRRNSFISSVPTERNTQKRPGPKPRPVKGGNAPRGNGRGLPRMRMTFDHARASPVRGIDLSAMRRDSFGENSCFRHDVKTAKAAAGISNPYRRSAARRRPSRLRSLKSGRAIKARIKARFFSAFAASFSSREVAAEHFRQRADGDHRMTHCVGFWQFGLVMRPSR